MNCRPTPSSERSARGSIPRRSAIYPKRKKNGSFRHFRSEIRGYERSALAMWNGNPNAITKNKKQHQELITDADFPDHVTPIIILGYQTGFDLGDIFDLDWSHIDFSNNQICKIRNKTSHKADNPQPVVVPMSLKVKNTLAQWGKQHGMRGRIFRSPITSGRLDNISKAWRSVLTSAEITDFRFKNLRHTFGSWLAIENVGILQIRDLMGHTDVKTTQVYAHLCPDRKEQSVLNVFS